MILKQIHKISVIGMLAVVIGIITVGPAMADDDDEDERKKHQKIEICHFDNEDGEFVELSIREKKAKGHAKNHVNDIIPAPQDGCPDKEESNDGINMELFMEDFTRHDNVLSEITNSQCSLGEVVTGFGPNGELLCSPDNTGEDTSFNIISRTETIELASDQRKTADYFCEPGEIMLGGIIETPSLDTPITSSGEIISDTEQSYKVTVLNRNSETVPVNVTYLCYDII